MVFLLTLISIPYTIINKLMVAIGNYKQEKRAKESVNKELGTYIGTDGFSYNVKTGRPVSIRDTTRGKIVYDSYTKEVVKNPAQMEIAKQFRKDCEEADPKQTVVKYNDRFYNYKNWPYDPMRNKEICGIRYIQVRENTTESVTAYVVRMFILDGIPHCFYMDADGFLVRPTDGELWRKNHNELSSKENRKFIDKFNKMQMKRKGTVDDDIYYMNDQWKNSFKDSMPIWEEKKLLKSYTMNRRGIHG